MYIMDLYMYMYKSMVIFLVEFFCHFVKSIPSQYFILFLEKITKIFHNYLQYEKVFDILYFHILNIVKFG
jgi:hypothetical protein